LSSLLAVSSSHRVLQTASGSKQIYEYELTILVQRNVCPSSLSVVGLAT
jgi:hypothetical protein